VVKLQKHKAYTYKAASGKKIEHFKYLVNVPESTLNKLGWNEGQELIVTIRHDSLILKPETQTGRGKKRRHKPFVLKEKRA
jgi:bifunctional DNA-binding transcriptional regulator/antitoxin component of YhaV-PrlF toxin-antitoxin module